MSLVSWGALSKSPMPLLRKMLPESLHAGKIFSGSGLEGGHTATPARVTNVNTERLQPEFFMKRQNMRSCVPIFLIISIGRIEYNHAARYSRCVLCSMQRVPNSLAALSALMMVATRGNQRQPEAPGFLNKPGLNRSETATPDSFCTQYNNLVDVSEVRHHLSSPVGVHRQVSRSF